MTIHGAKKGGGKPRQPIIAPDSAQSKTGVPMVGVCLPLIKPKPSLP